jgi:hypothetical protein
MKKMEVVWRQIADDILLERKSEFHQFELAAELEMSIGNVNLALTPLREIGAVDVVGKTLIIRDVKKILMFWAAKRSNLTVIGTFNTPESGTDLLTILPSGITLTSFAGYVASYNDMPAPIDMVRGYVKAEGDTLIELKRRFREVAKDSRIATLVVHPLEYEEVDGGADSVGPAQLYVDIWNERSFFAADYLRAIEERFRL